MSEKCVIETTTGQTLSKHVAMTTRIDEQADEITGTKEVTCLANASKALSPDTTVRAWLNKPDVPEPLNQALGENAQTVIINEIPDGVEKCDGNDRPGSPTEGVLNSNKKRKRTCFTDDQLVEFEALYKASCYPDRQKLADLGLSVNLPESRIRTWFQNRRARAKRAQMKQIEGLSGPQCNPYHIPNALPNSLATASSPLNFDDNVEKLGHSLAKHSGHMSLPLPRPIPPCFSHYPSFGGHAISETLRSPHIGINSPFPHWYSNSSALYSNPQAVNCRPGPVQSTFMSGHINYLADLRGCGSFTSLRSPFPEMLSGHPMIPPSLLEGGFGTGSISGSRSTSNMPFQFSHNDRHRHPYSDMCCPNAMSPAVNTSTSLTEAGECKPPQRQNSLGPWRCCSAAASTDM